MDPFGDDDIALLLRLKRYEQPPSDYFQDFLSEFRRRQRDELLRQPLWRICFERAEGFALRLNVRPLPSAGMAVVVACAAIILIRLYQQTDATELAVQESPVPPTPWNSEEQFDFGPPVFVPKFDMQPTFRHRSRHLPLLPADLPADSLRSDEFVPLELEWESLDEQSLLER
jgi:hypothetical protein